MEGIATPEAVNRFPEGYRTPFRNERFAVEPADSRDAHRPLPADADLEALFAETETRVVARDFTTRTFLLWFDSPETPAAFRLMCRWTRLGLARALW